MPVVPSIDVSNLRKLNKALYEIDPGLTRQVGKDIKKALKPFADAIMSKIPTVAPLTGFTHNGRTAWGKPSISVYSTPGSGRKSIARLEVYGKGDRRAAFKIADLAGTRKAGERVRRAHTRNGVYVRAHPTRSGDVLIDRLDRSGKLSAGGKGGRYVWAQAIANRPVLIAEVIKILDKYAKIVETRVNGG